MLFQEKGLADNEVVESLVEESEWQIRLLMQNGERYIPRYSPAN